MRNFAILLCITVLLILSGCASKTVKKPILPQQQLKNLQQQTLASRLPVPVQGVNRSQLTDTWGAARSHGRRHEGIDIMAEKGTKVYSTTNGVVASLKDNNLGGKVIWIIGPAGSWHYYAHLSKHKRGLEEGNIVRKGDLIGYVGNTGNARHTHPHLHYGLYLSGKGRGAVNPYPYLK
ncbi:M23 family metallopeptidase [Acinetobacter qingfengensis]|uniref:Peptidase M23 n=1 Tax=Acinetobacter qingfengensis TaxID=1262585 RepID=A0A1E7RDP1_9GAMM|nr:M23 family metallopeptidase [Acinetobacter qingfengensis]KAA8732181.1 M23 family metallopeptidase [Acinetobacter qingfengensis]OEY97285.1 peptidase M23 [Acinetobacter qingfengensis]